MFRIVGIIDGKEPVYQLRKAFEALGAEMEGICLDVFDTADIDGDPDVLAQALDCCRKMDLMLYHFHGSMSYFRNWLKFRDFKPYFFRGSIESEMEEMTRACHLPVPTVMKLNAYIEAGGEENRKNFLRFLLNETAGRDLPVGEVILPRWNGLYISDPVEEGRPVIGVITHFRTVQIGDTEHLDALAETIRQAGCTPRILYSNMIPDPEGKGGLREDLRTYFMEDGKTIPGAMIVNTGFSLSVLSRPGCGTEQAADSIFEILGIPAIHGLHTNFTLEQWQESVRGMDPMYLGNVFTGEFDGQLISAPLTCTERVETALGVVEKTRLIPDRAERIVALAKNWARLATLPNGEKKVAIILHNQPPRADMIGCAYGLDTPESVYKIVKSLQKAGYRTDFDFENGKDIIDRITGSLTNDNRFLSPEEVLDRAQATVGPEIWEKWFDALPERSRKELERDWAPAPGELMTVGDRILIPGIFNGNIFIGLQPPRAFEDRAEACYHSTDIVCPWQYVAFYRYLEQVFGANAVIHTGTHGTLEWLPGKEIGLSRECWPDVVFGSMPHLYPYIIDVPGEGAQAKRRSAACVIDHLIPSMTESGDYGDLSVIDDLISKYYQARQSGTGQLDTIAGQIRGLSDKLKLSEDLHLTQADFEENFVATAEKLHLWISEIKSSEIKDGLHIFGQVPEAERLRNMLRLLVRVKNGTVPSLRQGILTAQGLDLEELTDHPEVCTGGVTNAMRLEQADELGRQLFERWEPRGYDLSALREMLPGFCQEFGLTLSKTGELQKCLEFTAGEVLTRLEQTPEELSNLLLGLEGKFVKKGPSGAPSRGNAKILPTGRNFYTIDPTQVPTRASWETGIRLAKQLIHTHETETGTFPESIAIVVYSGDTIKTGGDDVAEILYLYGIRPVWLGDTDKVIGLEVIPREELGRPRIDVTLRISGMFRDTFPNLIDLIDEAVNMAATLEEPNEVNFIKKHIEKDMADFMRAGADRQQAYEQAALRIFGCPPGTYGAGVDILVSSKQWETAEDLGKAYITWSGHGYSRKLHGEKKQELFARRLSTCQVTVKNVASCEADMLDSDDFYNYHGGLISAVKAQSGQAPASYSTNSADTSHVVTKNIRQETARILRARINNPKWIQGLQKHGFRGAQEFSATMDILFGWDATADVMEDYMYDQVYETYLNNPDLREWIRQQNPWALHAMSERMLEAAQRQMWNADEDKLETLRDIYLEMEGSLEGEES